MFSWDVEATNAIISVEPRISMHLPSGKHTKNYGKSPFLMGKLTINGHFQ